MGRQESPRGPALGRRPCKPIPGGYSLGLHLPSYLHKPLRNLQDHPKGYCLGPRGTLHCYRIRAACKTIPRVIAWDHTMAGSPARSSQGAIAWDQVVWRHLRAPQDSARSLQDHPKEFSLGPECGRDGFPLEPTCKPIPGGYCLGRHEPLLPRSSGAPCKIIPRRHSLGQRRMQEVSLGTAGSSAPGVKGCVKVVKGCQLVG